MESKDFINEMKILSEAYGKEMTKEQVSIWYAFLKDCDLKKFKQAIDNLIKTSKYMPSIAEIRSEIAKTSNPNLSLDAEAEWEEVKKAIRNFDIYDSENALASLKPITRRALGMTCSWFELCTRPIEETKWMRKDFIAIFNREIGKTEQTEMLNAGEEQKRLNYE